MIAVLGCIVYLLIVLFAALGFLFVGCLLFGGYCVVLFVWLSYCCCWFEFVFLMCLLRCVGLVLICLFVMFAFTLFGCLGVLIVCFVGLFTVVICLGFESVYVWYCLNFLICWCIVVCYYCWLLENCLFLFLDFGF